MLDPMYDSYVGMAQRAGAAIVPVRLTLPDFSVPAHELRRAFNARTKLIMVRAAAVCTRCADPAGLLIWGRGGGSRARAHARACMGAGPAAALLDSVLLARALAGQLTTQPERQGQLGLCSEDGGVAWGEHAGHMMAWLRLQLGYELLLLPRSLACPCPCGPRCVRPRLACMRACACLHLATHTHMLLQAESYACLRAHPAHSWRVTHRYSASRSWHSLRSCA